MALDQAQYIILKTKELQMLKDVYTRVLNWDRDTSNNVKALVFYIALIYFRKTEDRVITHLKTGLHLIEDVPNNALYTAFKQVTEILNGNLKESLDLYELKPVDNYEKIFLLKKVYFCQNCLIWRNIYIINL